MSILNVRFPPKVDTSMVGEPGFISCKDAPVILPDFAAFADPAIIVPKHLVYGFLI